jgi:tetratricopeptide (TPR) repeat protein
VEVGNREKVDRLLREANVYRMRRQLEQAEEACRAVIELAPGDVGALEMLGDLLRERDKLTEAAEQYRRALEAAPGRPSVEKKYAEVALEQAERQRLRDLAQLALDQPELLRGSRRKLSVTTALLASLVWPGLGQFYVAEGIDLKGSILALLALLCSPGLMSLLQMMLVFMGARGVSGANGMAALGLLFVIISIYSIVDAVTQAQKSSGSSADRLGF